MPWITVDGIANSTGREEHPNTYIPTVYAGAGYWLYTSVYYRRRYVVEFDSIPDIASLGEEVVTCKIVLNATNSDTNDNTNLKLYYLANPIWAANAYTWSRIATTGGQSLILISNPAETQYNTNYFMRNEDNEVDTYSTSEEEYIYNEFFVLIERTPGKHVNSYGCTYPTSSLRPICKLQYTTPPINLTANQIAFNRVGVSWSLIESSENPGEPEESLLRYDVYRSMSSTSDFAKVGTVDPRIIYGTDGTYILNHYIDLTAKWDANSTTTPTADQPTVGQTRYYYKIKAVWKIEGQDEKMSSFSSMVYADVIQTTPVVQRFVIRDLEGYFPDYTFEINPTEYTPYSNEMQFQLKTALSGRKGAIKFNQQPEEREMQWDQVKRTMYLELRDRQLSGNTFYLIDHNSEEVIGVITEFRPDEIVSTVPSRYKLNMKITSLGKPKTSTQEY